MLLVVERSREWRVVQHVPKKGRCWLAKAEESSRTPEATFRNRRGQKWEGPRVWVVMTGVGRRLGTASCALCCAVPGWTGHRQRLLLPRRDEASAHVKGPQVAPLLPGACIACLVKHGGLRTRQRAGTLHVDGDVQGRVCRQGEQGGQGVGSSVKALRGQRQQE